MSKKLTTDAPATDAAEVITEAAAAEAKVPAPRLPYFDHSNCTHEKTPKARAACRAKGDAAEYYGRDVKESKPKVKKAKDAEDVPVKVKKSKKAKLEAAAERTHLVMWSSKGTGMITHWAILKDDQLVPACGNKLTAFDTAEATEVTGCTKCKAKGMPEAAAA